MVGAFESVGVNCYGLEAESNREPEQLGMGMMSRGGHTRKSPCPSVSQHSPEHSLYCLQFHEVGSGTVFRCLLRLQRAAMAEDHLDLLM